MHVNYNKWFVFNFFFEILILIKIIGVDVFDFQIVKNYALFFFHDIDNKTQMI